MNIPALLGIVRHNVPVIFLIIAAFVVTSLAYQIPAATVIDIGSGRDTPFVQGFSFRENAPDGTTLRWSGANSEIRLWGVGAQDGILKIRMVVPTQNNGAEVSINNRSPDNLMASDGFQEFTFPITRGDIGWNGNLIVHITSNTFNAPPDTRELGVQVDSAQFIGNGAPVIPSPRTVFYIPALALLAFFIGSIWSGNRIGGWLASTATILLAAIGLLTAHIETAYFIAPLFWFALFLFLASLAFTYVLQRLTSALNVLALSSRTLRLVFLVMAAAFALRMIFAVGPGYIVDVQDYVVWSYKTVTYGLGTMYTALNGLWISDQSPGLNYILHIMGLLYRGIFSPDFLYPAIAGDPALRGLGDNPAFLADPVQRTLLRLPMLFADILTGALIFTTARKYISEGAAWLVGFAFWFNPAVIWNGAYWGQTDAIHTLLVLICFLLIVFTRRVGLAFFILGIAAFTKPQAMIFAPLLLLAVYKNGAGETTSLINRDGLIAVGRAIIAGALGAAVTLLPVLLTGATTGLLAYFGDTIGHHPILTANAHNLWWLLYHDDSEILDTAALFPDAIISFRTFSILLFGIAYLITLLKAWRSALPEFFGLGAFIAFAFFMLPTEIHENYGYALLPLLAMAMTRERALVLFYFVVSVTMILNYALGDPGVYERLGLTDPHTQLAGARWFNALLNVILFGAWCVDEFARTGLRLSNPKSLRARGITQ